MNFICHIDDTKHETLDALHDHIKPLMKRENYYRKYHPKFDLFSKEPIPFNTVEQYLSSDFVNRENMVKWLKQNTTEGKAWAIEWLKKRKDSKQLIYAPCQVELRSLCAPSMSFYDLVGGYKDITKELGFKDRYTLDSPEYNYDIENATLIQDTREQTPISLSLKTIIKKLDVGDYALDAPHDLGIYIERKSLNDFVGSLSSRKVERKKKENDSSFERINRELERAKEKNLYIIMLVESSIGDALNFNSLPWMHYVKTNPSHIFKNLRELLVKYPENFQVVFSDGRKDAARKMMRIFKMGDRVKCIDLEYMAERGLL